MNISYAVISESGDREYNEDYQMIKEVPDGFCCVVADGLGGHGKGEVASRLVCESVVSCFDGGSLEEELPKAFEMAQEKLRKRQVEEHAEDAMKTTMNVLMLDNEKIHRGYIGDTRTYYFHKKRLISRTKDHSVPQMMVYMREIKEKDIRYHEDRNRLLKVMGIEWSKPQYAIEEPIKLNKHQSFLMCTDGFWEHIEEKEMVRCLKKAKTVCEWLELMTTIVRENGSGHNMDNYTAVAIWIN